MRRALDSEEDIEFPDRRAPGGEEDAEYGGTPSSQEGIEQLVRRAPST